METLTPSEVRLPAPWWQVIAVGRNPRLTLIRLVALVALTLWMFRYGLVPVRVSGISMVPSFRDGERRWISPALTRFQGLQRGDVVAIQTSGRHTLYLKRILGLPGERVRIERGVVRINGEPLSEPYLAPDPAAWTWPTNGTDRVIGPSEYFVVGDNRSMAQDAHYFGLADRSRILGKVVR